MSLRAQMVIWRETFRGPLAILCISYRGRDTVADSAIIASSRACGRIPLLSQRRSRCRRKRRAPHQATTLRDHPAINFHLSTLNLQLSREYILSRITERTSTLGEKESRATQTSETDSKSLNCSFFLGFSRCVKIMEHRFVP